MQDEVLVALLVMDLDIGEFGVDAEGKIGRESPWCSCPR